MHYVFFSVLVINSVLLKLKILFFGGEYLWKTHGNYLKFKILKGNFT